MFLIRFLRLSFLLYQWPGEIVIYNHESLGCKNGTWLEMCEVLLLVKLNVILSLKKTKKMTKESTIYPLYWHLGLESTKIHELHILLILIMLKKSSHKGFVLILHDSAPGCIVKEDLTYLISKLKWAQMSEQHSTVKRNREEGILVRWGGWKKPDLPTFLCLLSNVMVNWK